MREHDLKLAALAREACEVGLAYSAFRVFAQLAEALWQKAYRVALQTRQVGRLAALR